MCRADIEIRHYLLSSRSMSAGPSTGRSSISRGYEARPPEVLTIQEGKNFGSVWSEQITNFDPHKGTRLG